MRTIYYVITFLTDLAVSLTFATYVLFLLKNGLDLFQVNMVNFSFMIGGLIFEIPTGAYADYFGRKKSIVLSSFLMAIGLFVYFFSKNMTMFVIAELIAALALTFTSGALDAWLVDSLQRQKFTGKVDFVFSKANIISKSVGIIGGLAGAYLGNINLAIPFGVGAVLLLFTGFASMILIEDDSPIKKKFNIVEGLKNMADISKNSINYGLKHPVVLWLIVASVLSFFSFMPLNMFWSPRLNELAGDKVWLMGWVWAGFSVFMLLGSYLVTYLTKKDKHHSWILVATTIIMALPVIVGSYSQFFVLVLSAHLIHEVGRGMYSPIKQAYLNKHIPNAQRATILSFDSMMAKLGGAIGLVFFGWIGKHSSIQLAWLISGITLLCLIPIYLKSKTNEDLLDENKTISQLSPVE